MRWMTDEGMVVIEAFGNQVLVLESFDPATAERLRAAVFAGSAQPRAAVPHGLWCINSTGSLTFHCPARQTTDSPFSGVSASLCLANL